MDSKSVNLEKLFKAAAVLVVFIVSVSIPVGLSLSVQEGAKNARILMDMEQIRNWAQVYQLENKSYEGFNNDAELKRAFEDIKKAGGVTHVFVGKNYNSFCIKTDFKKGSRCVDSSGYIGTDKGICSASITSCH